MFMRLIKARIKNFRCYRNETEINFNNLTALIGKNDSGKSTILEALEIFFNNKLVSIDRDDLNKDSLDANDLKVEITCYFDELPYQIVIDANHPTSLENEYLLNPDGHLVIKKVFPCTATKPKEQVFIVANHPSTNSCRDLLQLKKQELKTRAVELGINAATYNGNINSSIRQAIWNHVGNLNISISDIPIDKEDSKKVWEELIKWMPVYALFQSDRECKEEDKEVTDPMKVAIAEALQEVADEMQAIQQKVRDKAIEVATRTLLKLQEMNPALANELKPDFKTEPKWNSIFSMTLASDRNIPINKRGSGVRRLIVLNFFRAEAERRRGQANNPNVIFAFEEPETSQHPDHQIMLVEAFKELATSANTQVILTTHTPALGGLIESNDLRHVTIDNGNVIVEEGTNAVYQKIAKTLGVLPDPLASPIKLMICVEGPNDISFLRNITPHVLHIDPTLPDLRIEQQIAIFPLGGRTLKDWVNNNYLAGLGIPEFHIYDRDDQHNPPYQQEVQNVIARGGKNHAVLTNKRECENYIHHDAINRVIGIAMAVNNDFDDVPAIIAELTHAVNSPNPWNGLSAKDQKEKISRAKKRLNREVVPQMTSAEFQSIDVGNEIISWFQEIKTRLE
jgi:putative ATP-dependent endonuclease of the OLD family